MPYYESLLVICISHHVEVVIFSVSIVVGSQIHRDVMYPR